MYIQYDILHKNYEVDGFNERFTIKEMLNLILEESEQHIPLSAKQQKLIEKVNKKLEKYGN